VKRLTWVLFTLISFILIELFTTDAPANPSRKISEEELAPVSKSVEKAIRVHQIPERGFHRKPGQGLYRRAFGRTGTGAEEIPHDLIPS
jgi:hypothetical protein